MSESLNLVDEMTLNIDVNGSHFSFISEHELYEFAHGALIKMLDEVLDEMEIEDDVVLDSLTLDLDVNDNGDIFRQIVDGLRNALQSKLRSVVCNAQSKPITNMLADIYRQHLPLDKSSNIERELDALAERWMQEHDGQLFNPLVFSESVIKAMHAEFPNVDVQQIACTVYQRILQLKNAKKIQNMRENGTSADTIYFEVADSGLVLLSPYIPMLFERLGCIQKGAWVSEDANRKALSVLKFATFGNYGEPPKNAAVMNLLCGFPATPVFYVDELPKLDDNEKELIEGLLKAVIANWAAVGHMSPDGLRSSFFVRQGRIEADGATDLLTVEKKTFDILLDKLPWGYSIIKHPWMPKVLKVKWR